MDMMRSEHGCSDDRLKQLLFENMVVTMNFSCGKCLAILSAVSGWNYKTGKRCTGGRWRCTHCMAGWTGDGAHAVAYKMDWGGQTLLFYGKWGMSKWVETNWPEVHQRWKHWMLVRFEYYAKVEPTTAIRDEPMDTHEKTRLILSHDFERALHNHILGDYLSTDEKYKDLLFEKGMERYKHFVAKGGRSGHLFHIIPGMRKLLTDTEFGKKHQLYTHQNMTNKKMYMLDRHDFGPLDCHDDHEDALKKTGGGRVRRKAFNRVFATIKGPDLEAQWALDNNGQPEEDVAPQPGQPVGDLVPRTQ
jgi:hypothetical protein